MNINFLEARIALTKKFTATTKEPYPNAYEFKSHQYNVPNLALLYRLMTKHAPLGHCLLKGELDQPLNWESRAGHTNGLKTTDWICLDIDGLTSVPDIPTFMQTIGLGNVSYILQWSASYGVNNDYRLRAHVLVQLTQLATPDALKQWLKHLNLEHFKSDLALTRTNVALHWGLDITTCQNDKLIFIAPPECNPPSINTFPGQRITFVQRGNDKFDFASLAVPSAESIKQREEELVNALRKQKGLTERSATKFKLKEHDGELYLPNPDKATVSSTKQERGFVYLNLNGGDSFAYYYPEDNPTFIYNFKGEPTYKTSELIPDYWASLQSNQRQQVRAANTGKLFLAFRDFRTAEYFNGWYDAANDELTLHPARSERQLEDFLISHKQPVPDAVPIWNVIYDPDKPTIDQATCTVNTFKPSVYMKLAGLQYTSPPKPTPVIDKIMASVMGPSMVDHFVNWLAFVFTKRTAPKTAWIWHGTQGTGKGILINQVLVPLLGRSNVTIKRMEELEDKFNGHLENVLLCFIDEAQISDSSRSKMIMANLKNQITEPTITIRRMRQSAYEVTNHVGYIFGSNMSDPVLLESSDRRHNVGEYQRTRLQISDGELKALELELLDFARRLYHHQIDFDAVRTTITNEAKQEMIAISRSSAENVAEAILVGDLSALWDALPTVEISMLDTQTVMKLQPYKQLVYDLVLTRRNKLTREELFVIFNYNVGNIHSSPWKFTNMLKHKGLSIKKIRIGDRVTMGLTTTWLNSDEWFNERIEEINAEKQPKSLQVVPKAQSAAA